MDMLSHRRHLRPFRGPLHSLAITASDHYVALPTHGTRLDLVVLDFGHRLPIEPGRVLNRVQLWRRPTVEDSVKPEVALEPLGSLVLVGTEEDFPDASTAFHLDEADLDERLRVLGVRSPRDQVKPAVLGLDALDDEPAGLLVLGGDLDRKLLDLVVPDHRSNSAASDVRGAAGPSPGRGG